MRYLLALLLAGACSDDGSLGGNPNPRPGDGDVATTPPMLIQPGDAYSYFFFKTYDPDPVSSATYAEKTVSGHACLKVTESDDGWPENRESLVNGQWKVVGNTSGSDVYFLDQLNGSATSAEVDAYMAPLWSAPLTFPTRGHGALSPTFGQWTTRQSIAPPAQSFRQLPFFDARTSDDETWRGWDTYLIDLYSFLQSRFGDEWFSSNDVDFDGALASGCGGRAESSCFTPCLWDGAACVALFTVEIAWRDTATVPSSDCAGGPCGFNNTTVIHTVTTAFTPEGVLRNLDEVIRPDTSGGAAVNLNSNQFTQCAGDGVPCLKAGIHSESWATSQCSF